jgi:hypothetical protein
MYAYYLATPSLEKNNLSGADACVGTLIQVKRTDTYLYSYLAIFGHYTNVKVKDVWYGDLLENYHLANQRNRGIILRCVYEDRFGGWETGNLLL